MQEPPSSSFFLEKPLPSSADAERTVLGAILLDNQAILTAIETITPDDFYSPSYKRIYRAMQTLFERGDTIDPILISEELKKDGSSLDTIGGVSAILNLAVGIPFQTDLANYANVIKDKSLSRQLIRECNRIASEAIEESENASSVIERAEQRIYSLRSHQAQGIASVNDLVTESVNRAMARANDKVGLVGLPTGFQMLDQMTGGMQKNDLMLLAARPSMGKSAAAVSVMMGLSHKTPDAVSLFLSLEMSREQTVDRMIVSTAKVNASHYRIGYLTKDEWARVAEASSRLEQHKIYIDDRPSLSVLDVKASARRTASRHGRLDLIVIDYIQLMRGVGKTESRQNEVAQISRDLKGLAKEMNVTVLALSQLSRLPESRADKRPMLSDLRESGGLEQDADIVCFLYRDEYYNATEENAGIAEWLIRKNRNGPTGDFKTAFLKDYVAFEELYTR